MEYLLEEVQRMQEGQSGAALAALQGREMRLMNRIMGAKKLARRLLQLVKRFDMHSGCTTPLSVDEPDWI